MQWLMENWCLLVATVAVLTCAGCGIYVFIKRPTKEQIASVKKWLLWAVTKAEKELGGGTGKLKLREVYEKFVTKFPWVAMAVSFETFSLWVDDALDEMKKMLEQNKDVKLYVSGGESDEYAESV